MGISLELQLGKAAEHIVCADLILRGFNAFLSDAGLPYDVVVDLGGELLRIQVKGTKGLFIHPRNACESGYRFGLRKGRGMRTRIDPAAVDVFAFVVLDARRVAYVRADGLLDPTGRIIGLVQFTDDAGEGRRGWGVRVFSKCSAFPPPRADPSKRTCFRCGAEKPATAEFFEPHKRCRGGIMGTCRECRRPDGTARKRRARERCQRK